MADAITAVLLLVGAVLLIFFSLSYLSMDKFRFHAQRLWVHLSDELIEWGRTAMRLSLSPLPANLLSEPDSGWTPAALSRALSEITDHAGPFSTETEEWDNFCEMTKSLSASVALYNKDAKQLRKLSGLALLRPVARLTHITAPEPLDIDLFHLFEFMKP